MIQTTSDTVSEDDLARAIANNVSDAVAGVVDGVEVALLAILALLNDKGLLTRDDLVELTDKLRTTVVELGRGDLRRDVATTVINRFAHIDWANRIPG
jgi:hypothetical protein